MRRATVDRLGRLIASVLDDGGSCDTSLAAACGRGRDHSDLNDGGGSGGVHVNGGTFHNYVGVAPCGDYSGQSWTTRPAANDKWHTLTNEFTGAQMCMDVVLGGRDDGDVVMQPCDGRKSQLWGSDSNP